jgi:hypothetical protein
VAAGLAVRVMSAAVVGQPGYTDAYYYVNVASRLARGFGLTADFVWNPIELGPLPVASHRFWMPLATVLQAAGVALFGPLIGDFRAAQVAIVAVAALVPAAAYVAARAFGATERASLLAGAIVALGGVFAPAWVSVDGFAPAALLGTLFFLLYARAARGSVWAGALAGVTVGLLYLTRTEGALFGLALVVLALRPGSRGPGLAGSLVAVAIGGAWLARDVSIGLPSDLLARTVLLTRYEEFFSLGGVTSDVFTAPIGDVIAIRLAAVATNAVVFVFAFGLILAVPLAYGVRALWSQSAVRAWAFLALLVFVAQSLLWTLHSTRGSYFHSLAAFFPFGIAIAIAGGERLLASRAREIAMGWASGTLVLFAVISFGAVWQWDSVFNDGANARAAVRDAIPPGNFLAIDAAAWRWIAGRSVIVTPSDGLDAAMCAMSFADPHPTSLVLEETHFRAYDALYQGAARPAWLGTPVVRGTVKIFPIELTSVDAATGARTVTEIACALGR